jgi:hypothetical protein
VPARSDLSDQGGSEHRPPELVVGGLLDKDVILTGKEPGQHAWCERIAPVAQQVGGGTADDEVDLELGMAMGAGSNVGDPVPNHTSIQANPNSDVVDHHKK